MEGHVRIDTTRELPVRELLKRLIDEKENKEKRQETDKKKKTFKFPWKWRSTMQKGSKAKDQVVVLYLNIKGEIEQPILLPLYSGNMVIIRNKVYEVDPRAFWTVRVGLKIYKVLLIREIDRRPVSNLDYSEIKARGDATDSDEFLIKAALRAQTTQIAKPVGKMAIILIVLAIIGVILYFFFS